MLSMLYYFFIAPLETLMGSVLSWAYMGIGSYGWALVILSLVVNLALLPIYAVAEGWQEDERRLRRKMAPKEAEIRSIFKGRERHAMLHTLQRQSGYSQLFPLRASVGFLLQVPFFFAAYHLLSHADFLRGVSFGFLDDLGAPDQLFTIDAISINLLPIIMTLVNLLSAFVYTQQLTIREKVQLYGLALIFLVALYESPAALTLYWTLNNVFSLGKNMVYARKENREMVWCEKVMRCIRSGGDVLRHRFGIPARGEMLLLTAAIGFASLFGMKGVGMWRGACVAAMIVIMGLLSLMFIARALQTAAFARHWRWLMGGLGIGCAGMAVFLVYDAYVIPHYELMRLFAIGLAIRCLPVVCGWLRRRKQVRALSDKVAGNESGLMISALFMTGIAVFLYAPSMFYASDPTYFSNGFDEIFSGLAGAFWVFILGGLLAFRCITRSSRPLVALVFSFIAFLSVLYVLIFTGNYGLLSGFRLENEHLLSRSRNYLFDGGIITILAIGFAVLVRMQRLIWLTRIACLVSVSIACVFLVESRVFLQQAQTQRNDAHQLGEATLPSYNDRFLSFSKDGKNVVVVVLDMFTGDHIVPMLEKFPDLKEQLSGFTWYRDTLSTGNVTRFGMLGIHGGPYYTAYEINKRGDKTYRQALYESYSVLSDFFTKHDYFVGWGRIIYSTPDDIIRQCVSPPDAVFTYDQLMNDYFPYWQKKTGFSANISSEWPFLVVNGLFRATPYSLRRFVYQRGKWRRGDIAELNARLASARAYAFFDTLASASNTRSPRNTFHYFYTDASHTGRYFSPETGMPTGDLQQFARFRSDPTFDRIGADHFFAELSALRAVTRWLDWLRATGIYDNTRLIITSDHGTQDSWDLFAAIGRIPTGVKGAAKNRNPGGAYPLLLVKDFGDSGPLRTSDALMSNSDVPDLATAGIGSLPVQMRGSLHEASSEARQRLCLYASSDHNTPLDTTKVEYSGFRVTGTMFKRDNWHVLGENE